jgi:hypothetical protein
VRLAFAIPNLVTFIQDDSIPRDSEERTPPTPFALSQNRVRRHHNIRPRALGWKVALCTIKCVRLETRGKFGHFGAPLTHNRLGHNNERAWLWVGEHGGDQLNSLAETHFITQKPAWEGT